jgi:hypothetical protein
MPPTTNPPPFYWHFLLLLPRHNYNRIVIHRDCLLDEDTTLFDNEETSRMLYSGLAHGGSGLFHSLHTDGATLVSKNGI